MNPKARSPSLATTVQKLWPTPNTKDALEPKTQEALEHELEHRPGGLNPDWVEWLMGLPIGWTSLEPLESDDVHAWDHEPECVPRVVKQCDKRRQRLTALGNAIVPQCVTELLQEPEEE